MSLLHKSNNIALVTPVVFVKNVFGDMERRQSEIEESVPVWVNPIQAAGVVESGGYVVPESLRVRLTLPGVTIDPGSEIRFMHTYQGRWVVDSATRHWRGSSRVAHSEFVVRRG